MRDDIDNDGLADELVERAGRLAKDVAPPLDLWPAIEHEIQAPTARVSGWSRYLGQAAAVLLLVGASSGLTYLAVGDGGGSASPVAQPTAVPLVAQPAAFGERYLLGPGFQDARRDLEGRLQAELARLSPAARAEVETSMQTIQQAIAEINTALTNEPENVLLQQLLLQSYQDELSLMRKVNGITNAVMLREDF